MPDLGEMLEPFNDPDDDNAEAAPPPRKSPADVRAIINQMKADHAGKVLRETAVQARRQARLADLDIPPSQEAK